MNEHTTERLDDLYCLVSDKVWELIDELHEEYPEVSKVEIADFIKGHAESSMNALKEG